MDELEFILIILLLNVSLNTFKLIKFKHVAHTFLLIYKS